MLVLSAATVAVLVSGVLEPGVQESVAVPTRSVRSKDVSAFGASEPSAQRTVFVPPKREHTAGEELIKETVPF